MKELSIEQKAKRYESALERCRKLYNEAKANEYTSDMEDYETIFPELKESDDEQHRKWILEYLYDGLRKSDEQFKDHFKCAIAWLEKQGKKIKPIEGFNTEFERQISHIIASTINKEYEYTEDSVKWVSNALLNYAKHEFEKQGEKPADKVEPKFNIGDKIIGIISGMQYYITKVCDNCYYTESGCIIMFCAQNNFELVEQNPAWSDEDEEMHKEVLTDIIYAKNDLKAKECHGLSKRAMEAFNWFSNRYKSLRPQNKCTYNPYKAVVESIAEMCKHYDKATDLQDFYDNVKVKCKDAKEYDSLFSQSQWKPSEEQMKVLNEVLNFAANHESFYWNDYIFGTLNNLIRQLKKLKEG